jgi:hypothetical protein
MRRCYLKWTSTPISSRTLAGLKIRHAIAIENQEAGGKLLAAPIAAAEKRVDRLVVSLTGARISEPARLQVPA